VVSGNEQPLFGSLCLFESLRQLMSHALSQLARVDEHERRPVVTNVFCDLVEDLRELAVRRDRLELGVGQLDIDIKIPLVTAVHDGRQRSIRRRAREQPGDDLQRSLRGRQPDALQAATPLGDDVRQAFETEREMTAPLVPSQCMDLVDDDRLHTAQHRARRSGRK
jgi:hypothetical protein